MRTVYIDANFICHADYAEGRTAVETDKFDHVCDANLCLYRFVPHGMLCEIEGRLIHGEFAQSLVTQDNAQREYERQMLAEYEALYEGMNEAYQDGVNSV